MEGQVLISPKLVLDTCYFFLLLAPYVLDKFYDYHRSLKHTDTQSKRDMAKFRTHRAESSFTSKWYKPQEKERAAFISRPWAKGVSRKQKISGVNGPFRVDIGRGDSRCSHKRHKTQESGETSWVQSGHPKVPTYHRLVGSVVQKPRARSKGCSLVLLGEGVCIVHTQRHSHTHTNFHFPLLPCL